MTTLKVPEQDFFEHRRPFSEPDRRFQGESHLKKHPADAKKFPDARFNLGKGPNNQCRFRNRLVRSKIRVRMRESIHIVFMCNLDRPADKGPITCCRSASFDRVPSASHLPKLVRTTMTGRLPFLALTNRTASLLSLKTTSAALFCCPQNARTSRRTVSSYEVSSRCLVFAMR